MNYKNYIRLKSFFLLLVLSLNTVVGFACAVTMEVGVNTSHYSATEAHAAPAYKHAYRDDPCHHGQQKKGTDLAHHKDSGANHHSEREKKNCCTDDVAKLLKQEKNIPHSPTIEHPASLAVFITPFYHAGLIFRNHVQRHTRYFVRNYHPPITDIRVAIQSFQI